MHNKIIALDARLGKGGKHAPANGDASEALFVFQAYKRGWELAKPFGHANPFDFVMRQPGGKWASVQVKTVYVDKQGDGKRIRCVSVRRSLGRVYVEGDIDYLFAASEADCWLIPWAAMAHKKSMISLDSAGWAQYLLPDL
jgi:hypothetical protein